MKRSTLSILALGVFSAAALVYSIHDLMEEKAEARAALTRAFNEGSRTAVVRRAEFSVAGRSEGGCTVIRAYRPWTRHPDGTIKDTYARPFYTVRTGPGC